MTNTNNWGGARAGAGRPRSEKRGRSYTMYLYPEERTALTSILSCLRSKQFDVTLGDILKNLLEQELSSCASYYDSLLVFREFEKEWKAYDYLVPPEDDLQRFEGLSKEEAIQAYRKWKTDFYKREIQRHQKYFDENLEPIKHIVDLLDNDMDIKKELRRHLYLAIQGEVDADDSDLEEVEARKRVLRLAYEEDYPDENMREQVRAKELVEFRQAYENEREQ